MNRERLSRAVQYTVTISTTRRTVVCLL